MGRRMNECAFSLPSVTYAMSARQLLAKEGITARVIAVDPSLTQKGCSHGIALDCARLGRAKDILLRHSIPIGELGGYRGG